MRPGGVLHRQHVVDVRVHPAVGEHGPHVVHRLLDDMRLVLDVAGAQRRRRDVVPQRQHPPQVQLRLRPALQADDHQMPVLGQRAHVLVEVLRADDVQDDVAAALELFREVLLFVVDQDVRAECPAGLQLLRGAGRHRDLRAERLGHLDRGGADAARAAVDEHALAFLQARDHHQVRPHRAGQLHDGGRLDQVVALRQRGQLALRDGHVLAVAAADEQAADFLADLTASVTGIGDGPGALQAEDLRFAARRRVMALGLEQVAAVDAGGGHLHQHFPRSQLRGFGLAPFQGAGIVEVGLNDCLHGHQGRGNVRVMSPSPLRFPSDGAPVMVAPWGGVAERPNAPVLKTGEG